MTQDEITKLLWEAIDTAGKKSGNAWTVYDNVVERFAALVAAHEREACAKVCEEIAKEYFECFAKYDDAIDAGKKNASSECAAAIRARGDHE